MRSRSGVELVLTATVLLFFGCSTTEQASVKEAAKCQGKIFPVENISVKRNNIVDQALLEKEVIFKTKDARYGTASYDELGENLIIELFKRKLVGVERTVISRTQSDKPRFQDQSVFKYGRQASIKLKLGSQMIDTEVWLFTASLGVVALSPDRDYSTLPYKSLLGKVIRITKTNDPGLFEATVLHDLDKGA